MNRANLFLLLRQKLAAAAPARSQTVRGALNSGCNIVAKGRYGTHNAEGDDHQQQRVLGSRGTFFISHKPTNYVQHGIHLSFEKL